jgi:hypothetical protein
MLRTIVKSHTVLKGNAALTVLHNMSYIVAP